MRMPVTRPVSSWNSLSPLSRGALFYLGFFGIMGMFLPFLNVYFRQDLGFSGRQIGILSLLYPLVRLTLIIPIASLADQRLWRIPILKVSLIGVSVMLVLASLPRTFFVWIPLRLVMALFLSPIIPLADSLIARMAIRHRLNYGTMRLWGSFSFALLAVGCGLLWEWIGFRAMFLLSGMFYLPLVGVASHLEEEPVTIDHQMEQSFWELRRDRGFVVLVITSFFIGASIYTSIMFDGIYMNALGGTQAFVGLMFGVSALSELPTMHYSDAIASRLSGPKTLLLAYSLFMLAFGGYVAAWHPAVLLPMAMIKGLGFGLFYVGTVRLVSERAPEKWASTGQSIINMSAFGLAPVIVSPVSGELYDLFGAKAIFAGGTFLGGTAALILGIAIIKGVYAPSAASRMLPEHCHST
ncbi:MFS transporter [candidate division KSB3 bacterium]|uniref:MFS transporter n=1 Tax=candidate division KSB3 bacterium TaxID=2044937 RepID=A0A9D5JWF8_9BACT|nr:MFS transporter [candidate division KSB3 bacterium]MBD3325399.1 MFS transporter [candidate division KSB3 bacterium]